MKKEDIIKYLEEELVCANNCPMYNINEYDITKCNCYKEEMIKTIEKIFEALDKSVKMQAHYGELLNSWDGGKRTIFKDTNSWLKRLAFLKMKDK